MSISVEVSLKEEISRREKELDRLREALRVISGGDATGAKRGRKPGKASKASKKKGAGRGRGPRGPKTAEQKLKISQALKKAWARRKKAAPAAE